MPGAIDLLSSIKKMHVINGEQPSIGLVSDFDRNPSDCHAILGALKSDNFFGSFPTKNTLSNEVGVLKPDEKIFRVAVDKIQKDLPFQNVLFTTENKDHIVGVKKFGMRCIRFRFPPDDIQEDDVDSLLGMTPLIQSFVVE